MKRGPFRQLPTFVIDRVVNGERIKLHIMAPDAATARRIADERVQRRLTEKKAS